jgi:hypothetical protein
MLVSSSLLSSSTPMLLMYLQVHRSRGQLLSQAAPLGHVGCWAAHHDTTTTQVMIHFVPIAARVAQLRVLLLLAVDDRLPRRVRLPLIKRSPCPAGQAGSERLPCTSGAYTCVMLVRSLLEAAFAVVYCVRRQTKPRCVQIPSFSRSLTCTCPAARWARSTH